MQNQLGSNVKYLFGLPVKLDLTRSVHWVPDYANVPRLGLRPNLLLDLAKPQVHAPSDTQRTLLVAVWANSSFDTQAVAEWGSDPNSGQGSRGKVERITDLAKPQVQGSDPHSADHTHFAYAASQLTE